MADGGDDFDYIVTGAGSGGCVVAARLSESGRHRVLLLKLQQLIFVFRCNMLQQWLQRFLLLLHRVHPVLQGCFFTGSGFPFALCC